MESFKNLETKKVETMAWLYQECLPLRTIGKIYGLSQETVRKLLENHGTKIRPQSYRTCYESRLRKEPFSKLSQVLEIMKELKNNEERTYERVQCFIGSGSETRRDRDTRSETYERIMDIEQKSL